MKAAKKTAPKKKVGRKPVSQDKISAYGLDALCMAIVGGETLTAIAKRLTVAIAALLTWIDADSERSARVKEARIKAARAWEEAALDQIQDAKDPFELAKAKEAAHHLRWRASKIAPREYGDKLQHGGAEDLPPMQHKVDVTMTPAEAYKAILGG